MIQKDAWEVVSREDWMKVLPYTWGFLCKRSPDGSVRKLKTRFCVRGDKRVEGIALFDTFAPVINWTTVRLMLILSVIHGLATKQVDYTAAFSCMLQLMLPPTGMICARKKRSDMEFMFACLEDSLKQEKP